MAACPCCSGKPYAICCRGAHRGGEPERPSALVRARFAAYARGEWGFLWRTLAADHADRLGDEGEFLARVAAGAQGLVFRRLMILAEAPVDGFGRAHVLFHADIRGGRRLLGFAEHSRFVHDGAGWRYLEGETLDDREVPRPIEALTFDSFGHAAWR